ncbi:MAG: MNIO family bufferin maturase [Pseudobdellovibrionaceae bacterium]
MDSFFKDLGTGVGLRPAHYSDFLNKTPSSVSWVEVISENFMAWQGSDGTLGRAFQTLQKIRKNLPVALHGVSLNLGSADKLDMDYLKRLKDLADKIDPVIISDHLAWTGVNGKNIHDLLPIPYTEEALKLIVEKIEIVQNLMGRRILIENPSSYLEFNQTEIPEWEFISTLIKKADCGLLLDINNVYVSSVNHGFDPRTYLKNIPQEQIGQIHLAGHSVMDGYLIDTHDTPICAEVWDLYRWSVSQFPSISTMVERDGNIPEWNELEEEILKIKGIRDEEEKKPR